MIKYEQKLSPQYHESVFTMLAAKSRGGVQAYYEKNACAEIYFGYKWQRNGRLFNIYQR